MIERGLAYRRHQYRRMVAHAYAIYKYAWHMKEMWAKVWAKADANNLRKCSCDICVSGTRKDKWVSAHDKLTRQERKFILIADEQEEEIYGEGHSINYCTSG